MLWAFRTRLVVRTRVFMRFPFRACVCLGLPVLRACWAGGKVLLLSSGDDALGRVLQFGSAGGGCGMKVIGRSAKIKHVNSSYHLQGRCESCYEL